MGPGQEQRRCKSPHKEAVLQGGVQALRRPARSPRWGTAGCPPCASSPVCGFPHKFRGGRSPVPAWAQPGQEPPGLRPHPVVQPAGHQQGSRGPPPDPGPKLGVALSLSPHWRGVLSTTHLPKQPPLRASAHPGPRLPDAGGWPGGGAVALGPPRATCRRGRAGAEGGSGQRRTR